MLDYYTQSFLNTLSVYASLNHNDNNIITIRILLGEEKLEKITIGICLSMSSFIPCSMIFSSLLFYTICVLENQLEVIPC